MDNDGAGFSDLKESLTGGEENSYSFTRIDQALREQGIPLDMLNDMDKAALLAALALDNTVLEQGNVFEALRSCGGLRDFMRLTEEERREAEGRTVEDIEANPREYSRMVPLILGRAATYELGGVQCTGEANPDLNHVTGECLDGYTPEPVAHQTMDMSYFRRMSEKSGSN